MRFRHRGGRAAAGRRSTSGSAAAIRPCGWAAHASGVRTAAAAPPAATIASSSSSAPRSAIAAGARASSVPRAASSARA
jgi:hypothetical protein